MSFMKKITVILLSLFFVSAVGLAVADPAVKAEKAATHQVKKAPVNINTADAATLAKVKGIGAKRAKAIVDYRTANGNFNAVSDLSNVKGISKKTLKRASKFLTV